MVFSPLTLEQREKQLLSKSQEQKKQDLKEKLQEVSGLLANKK
jgi:hypothetical protein